MNEEICKWLAIADKSEISSVFFECWEEYMAYLAEIASDIYDSCIADYYEWQPEVYDRHGYPDGINLYRANKIKSEGISMFVRFDDLKLWPYEDRKRDIREDVLLTVMDGIRGGGARKKKWHGWPQSWTTSYPNSHSRFRGAWSSPRTTIDSILQDFMSSALKDTKDYFFNLLISRI